MPAKQSAVAPGMAASAPEAKETILQKIKHSTTDQAKSQQLSVILGPVIVAIILALFWLPRILNNSSAATVNGENISQAELDQQVAFERQWNEWVGTPLPTSGPDADQFRSQVLDQMVEYRLIIQQAKKVGITASEQDVASTITTFESQLNLSDAQVNSDLAKAGLSRQTLESVLREDTIVNKYLSDVVLNGVAAADQQTALNNFYNDMMSKASIQKRIESGGAKVGKTAPGFTLKNLDGQDVALSDFQGKPLLINFFATWCDPCRSEMPDLEAEWQQYKAQGFTVLAVNLTNQDTVSDVQAYVEQLNLTFPTLLDDTGSVASLYKVGPIPTSYFIDKNGVLNAVQVGAMSRQTMDQHIQKLLQ
jgi:peroxiredoxin